MEGRGYAAGCDEQRRPVHPDGASGRADAKPWEHRAVVEQAEGIIMGEWRCSDEEAFAVLA